MPRMLSSLQRTQGARPAVISLNNRAGKARPRTVLAVVDKWSAQPSQLRSLYSCTTGNSGARIRIDAVHHCCPTKTKTEHGTLAPMLAVLAGGASGKGRGRLSVLSCRGARPFATLRTSRYDYAQVPLQAGVVAASSHRQGTPNGRAASNIGLGVSPRRPPLLRVRRHAQQQEQQQRRWYSSEDGFGGGQHFPHSDQV